MTSRGTAAAADRNAMPSTVKNNRKASKPLMEKRRRARINQSLSELKDLIVCSDKSEIENSRRSKLEKADILEMTVQHLHKINLREKNGRDSVESRQEESCDDSDTTGENMEKFFAGFHECVLEVNRYLIHESAPLGVIALTQLTDHLNLCAQRMITSGTRSPSQLSENPSPTPSSCSASMTSQSHRGQRHHPYHSDGSTSPSQLRPDSTTVTSSNRLSPVVITPESLPVSPSFRPQEPEVAMDVPSYHQNRQRHHAGFSRNREMAPPLLASSNSEPSRDRLTKGIRFDDYRAPSGIRLLSHNAKQAVKRDLKSVLRLPQNNPALDGPVWRPWMSEY